MLFDSGIEEVVIRGIQNTGYGQVNQRLVGTGGPLVGTAFVAGHCRLALRRAHVFFGKIKVLQDLPVHFRVGSSGNVHLSLAAYRAGVHGNISIHPDQRKVGNSPDEPGFALDFFLESTVHRTGRKLCDEEIGRCHGFIQRQIGVFVPGVVGIHGKIQALEPMLLGAAAAPVNESRSLLQVFEHSCFPTLPHAHAGITAADACLQRFFRGIDVSLGKGGRLLLFQQSLAGNEGRQSQNTDEFNCLHGLHNARM